MYFHWCRGRGSERLEGRQIRFGSGVESEDWGLRDWGEEPAPGESGQTGTRSKEADRGDDRGDTGIHWIAVFKKHFLISGPLYTQKLLKTPKNFFM